MKKRVLLLTLTIALLLPVMAVHSDPVWETFGLYPWINFKITGSGLHIASDPLFESSVVNTIPPFDPDAADLMKGWVTFTCATDKPSQKNAPKGFDFSVTIKDVPLGSYQVMAYPTLAFFPDGTVIPSDDLGRPPYLLGTLHVGGSGEGELEGFYDMPAGFFAWRITVESGGVPMYETHWIDPADFEVHS